jgi:hypothetical protein
MNIDLEKKLVKKYPNLYKQYGGDVKETCMGWGFSCGDGWYKLLEDLSEELKPFEEVVAEQVKEKFGGLRFYIGPVNQENSKQVYDIIEKYETLSYKTCEVCGTTGKRRPGGWVKTLCNECFKREM